MMPLVLTLLHERHGGPPPLQCFPPRVVDGRGTHAVRDPAILLPFHEPAPARVLLLDDVSTTGRTIREALGLLHGAGRAARALVGLSW